MKKKWPQNIRYNENKKDLYLNLETNKDLLKLFQLGEYYYYIFNPSKNQIEFISENLKKTLKLDNKTDFTFHYFLDNLHQDDITRFNTNENETNTFFRNLTPEKTFKYKVCYDFRLRNGEGNYEWISHQATTIKCDDQFIELKILVIHTIITHLKTNEIPLCLSFIGLEGEPSFFNINSVTHLGSKCDNLTKREKDILKLIVKGKSSAEIALLLFISKHTVNSHRKNILRKSNCKTNNELLIKTIIEGVA